MRLLKPVWVTHGFLTKDKAVGRPIYSLDIHPDGSRLATGGVIDTCGVVILWNMAPIRDPSLESDENSCLKLFQMDSHQACVNCVRWSPTGRWLASAGMDKVIMLWSKTAATSRPIQVFGSKEPTKFTEHWRCVSTLRGHSGDIIDLSWSHDGNRLASTSVDNSVIVWCRQKLPNGGGYANNSFCIQATLRGHQGFVKGVTWDPVGRYLASQGDDLTVKIWRTADWQEEASISKPFAKASGQSQVMRLSWSLDGSTLASPHAVNNGFPTAKLIDRNNWSPCLDLVGHRKHVICARYNPNVLRKQDGSGHPGAVCLALGSKDRSVSVWSTAGRRARIVVHDLFTNSVCDLTWSSDGRELMACSLDGSVCYMGFTHKELGTPWSLQEVIKLHHKVYGQSSLDKFHPISSNGVSADSGATDENKDNSGVLNESDILLETPEALALQKTQAELRTKLKNPPTRTKQLKSLPTGPSQQIETRSKDGRRRITPKFLGHLDSPDDDGNSNPQFTSPQPSRSESKSSVEIVSESTSDSGKTMKSPSSTIATGAVTGMTSATTTRITPTTATTTTNTTITTATTISSTTTSNNTTVSKTVTSASNSTVVTVVAVNGTTVTNGNKNNSNNNNNNNSNINKQPTSQVNHNTSVSKNTTIETKRGDETVSVSNTDVSLNQRNVSSKTVPSGVQAPSTTTIAPLPPPQQQPQQQPLASKKLSSDCLEQEIGIEQKRARLDTNDSEPPAQVDNAKLISDESAKVNTSNKQRKRRVRLFAEEEKSPKSGADATSSKPSAGQNNKKVCFSPESTPPKPKSVTISIPEPTDNVSSTIHSAALTGLTNPPPFIITTPDQLGNIPKVQFVCSNLVDGPIVVQLINSSNSPSSTSSEEGTKMSASLSRICANRGDRRLWELVSSDRLTSYAYSDEVIVIGDSKGRIQLFYSTGGRVCPNLLLDSVHTLVLTNETTETGQLSTSSSSSGKSTDSSGNNNNNNHLSRLHAVVSGNEQQKQRQQPRTTLLHNGGSVGATNAFTGNNSINKFNVSRKYRLAALCRSGRLIIWNFSLTNSGLGSVSSIFNASVFPQILVEANIKDILNGGHNCRFNSLSFGPNGYPVVYLHDNSSYLFHIESRIWIELFDASDTARYQFAVNVARGSPPGPLSACQQLSKIVNSGLKSTSSTGSNSSLISASSRRISNQNFLESQAQLALAFGSSNEYRYWLTRWFRQLIEDNEEERVRQIIQDLIGPVPVAGLHTSWQPDVKGLSKHVLAKELLSLFALNLHLQRLYVELKEMLNEATS